MSEYEPTVFTSVTDASAAVSGWLADAPPWIFGVHVAVATYDGKVKGWVVDRDGDMRLTDLLPWGEEMRP